MSHPIPLAATALALLLSTAAASAATNYTAILTGPNESPANTSPGVGGAVVSFDESSHILQVNVAFGSLTGSTTAAHIHCCTSTPGSGTAGVATETPSFAGFPVGVHSGA